MRCWNERRPRIAACRCQGSNPVSSAGSMSLAPIESNVHAGTEVLRAGRVTDVATAPHGGRRCCCANAVRGAMRGAQAARPDASATADSAPQQSSPPAGGGAHADGAAMGSAHATHESLSHDLAQERLSSSGRGQAASTAPPSNRRQRPAAGGRNISVDHLIPGDKILDFIDVSDLRPPPMPRRAGARAPRPRIVRQRTAQQRAALAAAVQEQPRVQQMLAPLPAQPRPKAFEEEERAVLREAEAAMAARRKPPAGAPTAPATSLPPPPTPRAPRPPLDVHRLSVAVPGGKPAKASDPEEISAWAELARAAAAPEEVAYALTKLESVGRRRGSVWEEHAVAPLATLLAAAAAVTPAWPLAVRAGKALEVHIELRDVVRRDAATLKARACPCGLVGFFFMSIFFLRHVFRRSPRSDVSAGLPHAAAHALRVAAGGPGQCAVARYPRTTVSSLAAVAAGPSGTCRRQPRHNRIPLRCTGP